MMKENGIDMGYAYEQARPNIFPLLVLGLIGTCTILLATMNWGIGTSPDSVYYLDAAHNITKGNGIIAITPDGTHKPMAHWPPLSSVSIALAGMMAGQMLEGARWLLAVLFGANTLLCGLTIHRVTRGSIELAILGSLLFLTAKTMLSSHLYANSEGLFLFWYFLGTLFLVAYENKLEMRFLVLSGIACGLGFLTRYAGAAMIATGLAVVFFRGKPGKRIRDALVFASVSCLPGMFWIIRNWIRTDEQSYRQIVFHSVPGERLAEGARTVASWFVPVPLSTALSIVVILLAVSSIAIISILIHDSVGVERSIPSGTGKHRTPSALTIFPIAYLLILMVTIFFYDASTHLNQRILSPVFAALVLLGMCFLERMIAFAGKNRATRMLCLIFIAMFSVSYLVAGFRHVSWVRQNGAGLTGKAWAQSETIERLERSYQDVPVYTNRQSAVYLRTGRMISSLPFRLNPTTRLLSSGYQAELNAMRENLRQQNGIIAYFDTRRDHLPEIDELERMLRLEKIEQLADGAIYRME